MSLHYLCPFKNENICFSVGLKVLKSSDIKERCSCLLHGFALRAFYKVIPKCWNRNDFLTNLQLTITLSYPKCSSPLKFCVITIFPVPHAYLLGVLCQCVILYFKPPQARDLKLERKPSLNTGKLWDLLLWELGDMVQ